MIIQAASLEIDFSRTPLDASLCQQFEQQQAECDLNKHKSALYAGEPVNQSENRAAHHIALRNPDLDHPHALEASKTLRNMLTLAESVRCGEWQGYTGKRVKTVVNIGIGGSDLGPRMLCSALATIATNRDTPQVRFIANIDPEETRDVLATCDPETTVFIIASKSFTTLETLENGLAVRRWLLQSMSETELRHHVVAITANVERAIAYGVAKENILPLWDWVGGRYSLWSAIGLSSAIAIGSEAYTALLEGAREMDKHFLDADLANNAPTLMALLEIYYQRQMGLSSLAVLPYSYLLRLLPDYLQQLCMESNGKSVKQNGDPVEEATCPILWGSAGTVGQHSFHQLLHQGTQPFAIDLIMPLRSTANCESEDTRHQHLVANCLAQSQAFTQGKNFDSALREVIASGVAPSKAETIAKQKVIPGGKPHTIIAMELVNAHSLGALIALYEHKTFVQSVMWGINAFDQWGVELGKQLSDPIYQAMSSNKDALNSDLDPVTRHWVDRYTAYQR